VYLVVDDFGRNVRVYRETDVEAADLETGSPTCSTADHAWRVRLNACCAREGSLIRRYGILVSAFRQKRSSVVQTGQVIERHPRTKAAVTGRLRTRRHDATSVVSLRHPLAMGNGGA
jgi:hypothetical protein